MTRPKMMARNTRDMTTVRELIEHLFKVEDLDEPVLYQYYLAEHFGLDSESKVWAQVVEEYSSLIPGMFSCSDLIAEAVIAHTINNQLEVLPENDSQ